MKETVVPFDMNPQNLPILPLDIIERTRTIESEMDQFENALESSARALTEEIEQRLKEAQALRDSSLNLLRSTPVLERAFIVERFQDTTMNPGSLHIEPLYGGLTLRPESYENVLPTSIRSVWIDVKGSDGIPGNNLTVKSIDRSEDGLPVVQLVSGTDDHSDILAAFDSNPDTWFEWEKVVIQRRQPVAFGMEVACFYDPSSPHVVDVLELTRGYGWTAAVAYPGRKEFVSGVPLAKLAHAPDTPARLTLEISLSESATDCWMEILPYHIGGRPMRVASFQYSLDGVNWRSQSVMDDPVSASAQVAYRFYLHRAAYLRLTLEAGGWYRPTLGFAHPFSANLIRSSTVDAKLGGSSFGVAVVSINRFLERAPTTEPKIGTVKPPDGEVSPAEYYRTATGMDQNEIVHRLRNFQTLQDRGAKFSSTRALVWYTDKTLSSLNSRHVEGHDVLRWMDVFTGWRSAIGIREIRMVRRKYEPIGEWVSPRYRMDRAVTQLVLKSHDYVPDGCSVEYQIRVGDGEWQRVERTRSGLKPISLEQPASEVQVRVVMRSDDKNVTPVVYSLVMEGYAS